MGRRGSRRSSLYHNIGNPGQIRMCILCTRRWVTAHKYFKTYIVLILISFENIAVVFIVKLKPIKMTLTPIYSWGHNCYQIFFKFILNKFVVQNYQFIHFKIVLVSIFFVCIPIQGCHLSTNLIKIS